MSKQLTVSRKGFIFDVNKCVGCHACVVACNIENSTEPGQNWRNVYTFNENQHLLLPLFSHSLACNHCIEAPCLKSCPANAYSRDKKTGAVLLNKDKCMGCKYCTWACPYDTPKFNKLTSTVEKCTFCNHRLEKNEIPACANLCPTGALSFGEIPENTDETNQNIPGFTNKKINPSIKINGMRKTNEKPEIDIFQVENYKIEDFNPFAELRESKITIKKEWILVLFTLLIAFLSGTFTAWVFGGKSINPAGFIIAGVAGMLMSFLHLGKKQRAYRAIFNLKTSWLSREIFFFSGFIALAFVFFFILPSWDWLIWPILGFGFSTAISADMVYRVISKQLHSASITLTALFLTSLLSGSILFSGIFMLFKFLLYIRRKIAFAGHKKPVGLIVSTIRICAGFFLPALIWIYWGFEPVQRYFIFAGIMAGEIIDRIEFYLEADVITPKKQMLIHAEKKSGEI